MTFAQRRNRLTTHFSEHIPVVKRRSSVLYILSIWKHKGMSVKKNCLKYTHRIIIFSISPHPPCLNFWPIGLVLMKPGTK